MNSDSREFFHFLLSALALLAGTAVTLSQTPAWEMARINGSDHGLQTAIGGILLITTGIAAITGALLGYQSRAMLVLAAVGYSAGIPVAVLVAMLATQSWDPLGHVIAAAFMIGGVAYLAR